jgi:hypothetical protein
MTRKPIVGAPHGGRSTYANAQGEPIRQTIGDDERATRMRYRDQHPPVIDARHERTHLSLVPDRLIALRQRLDIHGIKLVDLGPPVRRGALRRLKGWIDYNGKIYSGITKTALYFAAREVYVVSGLDRCACCQPGLKLHRRIGPDGRPKPTGPRLKADGTLCKPVGRPKGFSPIKRDEARAAELGYASRWEMYDVRDGKIPKPPRVVEQEQEQAFEAAEQSLAAEGWTPEIDLNPEYLPDA